MIFPYEKSLVGQAMPLLKARMARGGQVLTEFALVDSGAGVNVLPQSMGLVLGLDWGRSKRGPNLSGNADGETKVIILNVQIASFDEVPLLFAWSVHDRVRFIFGQDDFFKNFHTCFFADKQVFSVTKIGAA